MARYNIALIPLQDKSQFIRQAEIFNDHDGIDYLLSEQSLPHITLTQFRLENSNELANLWKTVTDKLADLNIQDISLRLLGLHFFHDLKRDDFLWLQLIPDHEDFLRNLHYEMVACLQKHNLTPINRSLEDYAPHLTLLHTPNLSYRETVNNYPIAMQDKFCVCLGESDEIGQLMNVKLTYGGPSA